MAVIGIDLGTTYSAAARYNEDDDRTEIIMLNGQPTMPSVVSVSKGGKIQVGWPAKRNQALNPQDTIVEVKRLMGENQKLRLGQKEFLPQEVSALILKEIKDAAEEELGEPIEGVVISCPAYFKDPQRAATAEAGKLAGLNVLRIINEPTAAAYAYGLAGGQGERQSLFLVYDLGGGTFDVTVIEMAGNNLRVIGTGGDPNLGGGDFDDLVVGWMLAKLRDSIPEYVADVERDEARLKALKVRLKAHAEEAKIKLCGPPEIERYQFQIADLGNFRGRPVTFTETLTMAEFEALIGDLLANSMKRIDEAMDVPKRDRHYTEDDLTDILLVGGSTRVPLVHRALAERFPKTPIRGVESGINPDEIVARGASIVAAEVAGESVPETVLVDVTGHTLSVKVRDAETQQDVLHPLIPKEKPIPCQAEHTFATMGEFQRQARIEVFQGEGRVPTAPDVLMIGEFLVDLPPVQESIPITVGLALNENSLLVARAVDGVTGREVRCQLNYDDVSAMTPEQVRQRAKELEVVRQTTVGATANPLDERTAPGPTAPMPAQARPAQPAPTQWAHPARPVAPSQPSPALAYVDPVTRMNPVMRSLYQRAVNNYAKIPADRQAAVMELVVKIDQAAQAGDPTIMQYFDPLSKLMEGVE